MRILLSGAAVAMWAVSSAWALPTADELLAKVKAKLAEVRSMEADVRMIQIGGQGDELTGHLAMQMSEKDGKTVKREYLSGQETTPLPNGKKATTDDKVVDDGTTNWLEERHFGDRQIRVTKNGPRGDKELWPEGRLERAKASQARFALTVTGEETVDGQKMYVLEGTYRPDPGPLKEEARKGSLKEETRKLWIGQKDLMPHRWSESRLLEGIDGASGVTYNFTNIKLNQTVDAKLFEYTPPEGAVVDDKTKQ